MRWVEEWILKPMVIIFSLPFLILFSLLGFIHCWQCHKVLHFFKSKKYHLITFGSERVCKDCYELLTSRNKRHSG